MINANDYTQEIDPIGFDETPEDPETELEAALNALTGCTPIVEVWYAYTANPARAERLIESWRDAGGSLAYERLETVG